MLTGHTAETLQAFEADIAACFNNRLIRAPIHLSGGNEQQLLDLFEMVRPEDWVATAWRSHYHCLLKGVPPATLRADILAGKSITLCYPEQRIISSAIVGGVLPIAVGLAWAAKRNGSPERVWAFVGDMTAHTGVYRECVDYTNGHELPLIFIIEDNEKSVCTDTRETWGTGFGPAREREIYYRYSLTWPHSGAGTRVNF